MTSLLRCVTLALGLILGQSECLRYSCREASNSTCVLKTDGTVYVSPCPKGEECDLGTGTCLEPKARQLWPGESCLLKDDCVTGICEEGKCLGRDIGEICQTHENCNPPLYCSRMKTCDLQLAEHSWQACRDDYDCRNYLTCQYGRCVPYLSRLEGELVSNCVANRSMACSSTLCLEGRCLKSLANDRPIPVECESEFDCVSNWYSTESHHFPVYTQCNCALDTEGKGVCELFPGDTPYADYLTAMQHLFARKHNWACHTLRRFETDCLEKSEYHRSYAGVAAKAVYAQNYAGLVRSQACVQEVYFPEYLAALQIVVTLFALI